MRLLRNRYIKIIDDVLCIILNALNPLNFFLSHKIFNKKITDKNFNILSFPHFCCSLKSLFSVLNSCRVLFAFLLWLALLSMAYAEQDLTFSNFSKNVSLIRPGTIKQETDYLIQNADIRVTLSNRLIVKTLGKITRTQVMAFDSHIKKVTELYAGRGFHYFSVELKAADSLPSLLNKLSQNPSVLLVQPDVLQLKENAAVSTPNEKITSHIDQAYLQQLGISQLWKRTKGSGAKLAIIDDGIDLTHPAFINLDTEFAYDTQTQTLSAVPVNAIDSHGTQVAGVIFAPINNKELKGIAPEAQLIAIRQPDTWTSNTLLAFNLAALAHADIINCSWNTHYLLEPVADVVNDLAVYGREGKGTAIIFSAGNEGVPLAQMKTEATINSAITVGALDAQGAMLASSNYGAGVDLSVYGAGVRSTANQGKYRSFSGTSLSAAIVSGLAALLISEQPDITLNELQQKIQQRSSSASQVQLSNLANKTNVNP